MYGSNRRGFRGGEIYFISWENHIAGTQRCKIAHNYLVQAFSRVSSSKTGKVSAVPYKLLKQATFFFFLLQVFRQYCFLWSYCFNPVFGLHLPPHTYCISTSEKYKHSVMKIIFTVTILQRVKQFTSIQYFLFMSHK